MMQGAKVARRQIVPIQSLTEFFWRLQQIF